MRVASLILALLCASPALAQETPGEWDSPVVLAGPLSTSGLLNTANLSCAPSLVCFPDSDSWNCWSPDADGALTVAVAVTQGAATGFEATPYVPGPSGTVARYAARIDAAGEAPRLTTPAPFASLWTGDFTLLLSGQQASGAQKMMFSHATANADGVYCYSNTGATFACITNRAGALDTIPSAGGFGVDRLLFNSLRRSSTTCTARTNGNNGTPTACSSIVAPTTRQMYFGRYESEGVTYVSGPLALTAIFPCALTDTELLRIESQWAGTIAESRNVPLDRNSTAGWVAPDGYYYAVGDDMGRVDARGLLVEEQRTNYWLNSSAAASWVDKGTPVITANTESGPFSRYFGAAEVDTLEDDDAGVHEGKDSASAGTTLGAYTASCYLAAGTLTTAELAVLTDGGGSAVCAVSGLSETWQRKTCSGTVTGSPTYIKGEILIGTNAASVGTIKAAHCQLEPGAFASQPIPTGATATARLPDKPLLSTVGFPTGQGALSLTVTPEWSTVAADAVLLDTRTGTNGIECWVDSSARLTCSTGDAGGTSYAQSAALTWTPGTAYRIEIRWGGGTIFVRRDSVVVAQNVTGTARMPTAHAANAGICATVSGTSQANGWLSLTRVSR